MMISEYSNMAMTLQVPQIRKNKKQSNQGRHEKLSKKKNKPYQVYGTNCKRNSQLFDADKN